MRSVRATGGIGVLRLRTLAHLSGEAVASVRDNSLLSIAAVSTVAISLLVLSIVTLLAVNMQHLAAVLNAQVQIVAYLDPAPAVGGGAALGSCQAAPSSTAATGNSSATVPTAAAASSGAVSAAGAAGASTSPSTPSAEEQTVIGQIEALPGVTKVQFVSKQQALNTLVSELPNGAGLIRGIGTDNPLPDYVNIFVADPQLVAGVAGQVASMPGVSCVRNDQQYVNDLFGFTQSLRYVGIFLIAALALTTLVVIGNTVRVAVYARRDQIGIMKLVGATDSFIRLPFFIEGAILGLIGALVSGLLVAWGYGWVQRIAAANMPFLPLLPAQALTARLLEGLALGGLLLGALGSAISVRRHLNV